jgi:hypothetical protein
MKPGEAFGIAAQIAVALAGFAFCCLNKPAHCRVVIIYSAASVS